MTTLQERFKEAIEDNLNLIGEVSLRKGKAAIACEKIAEEFACELAEWTHMNGFEFMPITKAWICEVNEKFYTTSELLQQFKEERK